MMLPYLACYMGHADLRGTQYYLRLTADAYPDVIEKAQIRFGYVIPAPPQDEPELPATPPSELAGRWLTKFFTSYLAGERAASPRTIVAYRDAIKLLLTWFKETERIPPENSSWLTSTGAGYFGSWTGWRSRAELRAATRNQRLAVIKSFCRYTAVEQPGNLDQVTQILAIRQKKHAAPATRTPDRDETKALLAEPGTASARAVRDTVLLAVAYDTAARVQELCDLNVADIRTANPITVTIRGKGSKTRYVPLMDPTAELLVDYLEHLDPHPGLGGDTSPLSTGRTTPG